MTTDKNTFNDSVIGSKIAWFARSALVSILSANLIILPTIASAQTAPDTSAPGTAPSMDQAPNGVPIVNITTPSGKGVSHNRFTELNIDPKGMIFNNSKNLGTSQLGGVVLANPNLKNSSTARIILNEVTGSNSSQLRGFSEVFGDRAQFIIANPNGIACDGCGFINTSRTTLTTGNPDLQGGELIGLDVDGSALLTIEGSGLNAEDATALDLLARTIRFNAPVNAQELKVFTGRNLMDYGARIVTPKSDDGSTKPALAIDGSHFGAMYANQISVIATEQGVGVRMPDNMATGLGDLIITADGGIALSKASATGNIKVASTNSDVTISDTVNSTQNVTISGQNVTNNGNLIAGLTPDGSISNDATLNVSATQVVSNTGQMLASGAIMLESIAGSISNSNTGNIKSNGTIKAKATANITNAGRLHAAGTNTLTAGTIKNTNTVNTAAILKSDSVLTLNTDTLDNTDGQATSKTKTVISGKTDATTLTISGDKITSDGDVEITADTIDNRANIEAQEKITVTALTGGLSQSGNLQAGNTATLTANSGTITNDALVKAVNDITIAASTITNTANGSVESGKDLGLSASVQVANAGTFSAQNNLKIQSDIVENDDGALLAVGDITLDNIGDTPSTLIANRSGVIETLNGDITINATDFINERKNFSVSRQQTYSRTESTVVPVSSVAGGISTQYLEYNAANTLFFRHPDDSSWLLYYDYGPILVRQYKDVATSSNAAGYLSSGGTLTISADTLRNAYSHISSAGDMTLSGGTLENVGQILTKQTTIYKSGGQYNRCQSNKGCQWLLNGAGERELSSVAYDSVEGTIQAGGQLLGSFTGQIDNKTILGSVNAGDLVTANTVLADIKEAPPLTSISLIDFFDTLPAKNTLTQLAPPNAKSVFETRTEFANPSVVLGGDYFLSRVDINIDEIPDRFAFNQALEERVVQNAIRLETGKRWLDPSVQDASLQLKYLIDNGIDAQDNLNLTVGVELTPEQIGQLNQDIIWYVEETINGERVLSPKLYLASANSIEFAQKGGLIVASSVDLDGADVNNSGDIVATNGSVGLTANEDINIHSGRVGASDDINLKAGGSVTVATDTKDVQTANNGMQSIVGLKGGLDAGDSVNVQADENVIVLGADISAQDDVKLSAGDNLIVGAVAVNEQTNWGDENTYDRWTRTTNRGSNIKAGGNITTVSVSDTIIQGSKLDADGDVDVTAVGDVAVLTARDTFDYEMQRNGGEKTGTGNSVRNVRSDIRAGGNVNITSLTGDITAQAAKFSAEKEVDGTVTLNAEHGKVALISATDEESWTYKSDSSNALTYKMRDAGAVDTTVVMTEITADGGLIVNAGNGVIVEYRDTGNLEDSVAALSATPGLEWMGEMMERDDATWRAVKEVHDSWDYKSQGLSGAGAAVIAIAVTVVTAGAGGPAAAAGLAASNAAVAAGASTAVGAAIGAAVTAGVTALATQASISLINNKGDIGAVLKELGSSASLRSLATSMVTAGLLNGVGGVNLGSATANETLNKVATRLVNNSIRSIVSASLDTAINGGDGGDNLKSALQSAAVMAVGAMVAEEIGKLSNEGDLNYVSHKLAHATLGCAIGVGTGGDCAGGAIGAAAGEVVGELYFSEERQQAFSDELKTTITDENLTFSEAAQKVQSWKQQGLDVARLAGVLSAFVAGADVHSADTTSSNATENNLCGTGLCATGTVLLLSAAYTYAVSEGEGDFYAGLGKMGRGEDVISEMSAAAIEYGIEGAYAVAPDSTVAVLDGLAAVGELGNAVVTYTDDLTGNVVSRQWNAIPQETKDQIKGGITLASVMVPATNLAKLAPANISFTGSTLKNIKKNWPGGGPNRIAKQADVVDHFQQNRQFWSQDPVQFNGNKIYQRNDLIDPNKVDPKSGKTNLELMNAGRAPLGSDGKPINLHHLTQKQDGAIAEVTQTLHSNNHGTLHIPNTVPSGINRAEFNTWCRNY